MATSADLSIQVWLMRHGETEANRLGIVQGQNATPLSETGIQQAKTSAQALARAPFSHIYCSDLVRTRRTVEHLVALRGQDDVIYDARLREKGAGTAEGLKLVTLHKMQKDSGQNARVYKPEGGESWDEVRARANSFYEHLLELMRQGNRGPVLVVTHGGFIMESVNTIVRALQLPALSFRNIQTCTELLRIQQRPESVTHQAARFTGKSMLRNLCRGAFIAAVAPTARLRALLTVVFRALVA